MKQPSILNYEYLKSVPAKAGEFQSHAHYEIFYFHEGEGHYLIGDRIHQLQPGMLIVMHGLTLHSPCSFDGFPYVRTLINFDQSYVRAAGEHLFDANILEPFEKFGNYAVALSIEEKTALEGILAAMQDYYIQPDAVSQARFRLRFLDALCLVYEILKKPLRDLPVLSNAKERHIQAILSYVEHNLAETIHLVDLENALHLNRYHLARIFREVTGMTVFQYILRRRLNEAKLRLLTESGISITDVCYVSGFKNLSHFSRVFKEQEGCSPEQYRRRLLLS